MTSINDISNSSISTKNSYVYSAFVCYPLNLTIVLFIAF